MSIDFTAPVPVDGYLWWYVDAISADARHALSIIALVGSVFSPYYAGARRRGCGDPMQHCALNVALYGPGRRWSMTERGRTQLHRSPSQLCIGPSVLDWDGSVLTLHVEEVAVPVPRRIRGRVRLRCPALNAQDFALDERGRHRWRPIAPVAHASVEFDHPRLAWEGAGYLDSNWGSEPLEHAFASWDWSRAALRDGSAALLYDVVPRRGATRGIALRADEAGAVHAFTPPPPAGLPSTLWRVRRATRTDPGTHARVCSTLEDTPFYARSTVEAHLLGESVTAMHESVSLERFDTRWVQALLPFRMPRRAG